MKHAGTTAAADIPVQHKLAVERPILRPQHYLTLCKSGTFVCGLQVVTRLLTAQAAPRKPGMHFSRHGSHFR